jgi:hypothetical protein
MKALGRSLLLVLVLIPVTWGIHQSEAATYPATIKHYQTMTKLLDETQLRGWPSGLETAGRHIEEMVAHRDGADLAFTVTLDAYSDKHLYVLTNGLAELVDCTSALNAAGINPNNVYGLHWSHEKRLFFLVANTYDMYYYLLSDKVYPAFKGVPDQGWVPWPYSVNYEGTRLFFKGALNGAGGLYYSDVPGPSDPNPTYTLHPMMLMSQLPGPQNWNVLRFLGASWEGGSLLCTYFGSAAGNSIAMWRVPTPLLPPNPSQAPVKVLDEEHTSVWGSESNIPDKIIDSGIGSADGGPASVLYACQDSGQNEKLYYYSRGTDSKQLLSADGGSFLFPTLYDDGYFARFARFTSPGHKATVVNLLTGEQRDTHSSLFAESSLLYGSYYLTDLTDDSSGHLANHYFMASKIGSPALARLDLIDMAPFYRWAPIIDIISFSKPLWLFDGTMPLTITVHVTDPTGLNILWVNVLALVDGLEQPVWLSGKPFVEGQLTDQGGGVYTFTTTLNKSSNFFTNFKLPKDVGIRIIAKNAGEHYGIADTTIRITTRAALSSAATIMLLED